jgi:hypothetical protein
MQSRSCWSERRRTKSTLTRRGVPDLGNLPPDITRGDSPKKVGGSIGETSFSGPGARSTRCGKSTRLGRPRRKALTKTVALRSSQRLRQQLACETTHASRLKPERRALTRGQTSNAPCCRGVVNS